MTAIDQSKLRGKIRDLPISKELESLLRDAGEAAGIDTVFVTSGRQPGSKGKSTGSTRHNQGRAADLYLVVAGKIQKFSDSNAPSSIEKFVTACAARGAIGIGAGVHYMGANTLHVGFGRTKSDAVKVVWGAGGRSANAPTWLRSAAKLGWNDPPDWVFDLEGDETEDLSEEEALQSDVSAALTIPDRFDPEVVSAAIASARKWSIPASVTLAQWALESAYGTRMPAGSNNPFGIKARPGEPSVTTWTTEVIDGKSLRVSAAFRVFPDVASAFERHGRLLGSAGVYANARKLSNDANRFADALTGVYATDPNYGSKLKSIMRGNDLYKFDADAASELEKQFEGKEIDMPGYLFEGHPDKMAVETLQRRLTSLGYKLGAVDGLFGPLTSAALLAFQNENGIPTTGVLDDTTQMALNGASERRLGKDREAATEAANALAGSRTLTNARRGRLLSWILGGTGALGLGNSAVVNSGTAPVPSQLSLPPDLLAFLTDVQRLSGASPEVTISNLTSRASSLINQLNSSGLPTSIAELLERVRSDLPSSVLANNPDLARLLDTLGQTPPTFPGEMRTVLDVLPNLFANDTVMQSLTYALATAGSSVLPGFGGSLGVLAAGLLGRHFSNKVASARVDDHRSGANINSPR